MKLRRAVVSMGPAMIVLTLIVVGITIAVGGISFSKTYTTLDGLRDSDFTAEANTTITGVGTDFWAGVDLVRLLMIIIPSGALIGAVVVYLVGRAA